MQQRLYEWILHPEYLNKDSLFELRNLLARYPYFQTVRLLYLKNLFLLQDADFKDELRKSALYIADLSVLFYYIEGERLVIKKHPSEKNVSSDSSTDRTLDLIDRFLSDLSEETSMELPLPAEVNVDYTSILMQEPDAEPASSAMLKGQDLIDNFIEQSAGSETLAVVEEDDLMQESDTTDEVPEEIDIQEGEDEVERIEESSDENYFTETLAKIYVKQQRYDKALEIIKKLNLKYPKKNAYFADQIRFLEKLIINAKSK